MMSEIKITKEEQEVLHKLLLDIPASKIEELGIDKEVYSRMGSKSVVLNRDGHWPEK
jgi:hypothetical protein